MAAGAIKWVGGVKLVVSLSTLWLRWRPVIVDLTRMESSLPFTLPPLPSPSSIPHVSLTKGQLVMFLRGALQLEA